MRYRVAARLMRHGLTATSRIIARYRPRALLRGIDLGASLRGDNLGRFVKPAFDGETGNGAGLHRPLFNVDAKCGKGNASIAPDRIAHKPVVATLRVSARQCAGCPSACREKSHETVYAPSRV